jgi:hypothetical protein
MFAPPPQKLPAGQGWQAQAKDVLFATDPYVPATHCVHCEDEVNPVRFDQLPAGQASVTDEFVQYCPMAQSVDADVPMGQYCPEGQGVGGHVGSAQVEPAGHGAHIVPAA